ncbi:hypothetical protein [Pectobacterium polaris]|uniref:hypothetical protein n=1 Tax=Pectobacterium polaris TaxID=2042057 RepID=UPI0032EB76FB
MKNSASNLVVMGRLPSEARNSSAPTGNILMKSYCLLLTIISFTADFRSGYRLNGTLLNYRGYEAFYILIGMYVIDEAETMDVRQFALNEMQRLAIDTD